MSFILRFLPSFAPMLGPLLNPWVLLAFVVYTGIVAGAAGFKGYDLGISKLNEHLAEDARAEVRFVKKVVKVAGEVRTRWLKGEERIVVQYQTIEREAANVPSRPACNATSGWVRVHDAAADGAGSSPVGAVDDKADSGVGEAQALGAIVRNYRSYHQVANDLTACREAWRGVAAKE